MRVAKNLTGIASALGAVAVTSGAMAQEGLPRLGKPVNGGMSLQNPATELMRDTIWLDNYVLIIVAAISVFVTVLLAICILRYNRKANPVAAAFTHNSALEVAWTIIPIIILIAIIPFSLATLFKQEEIPEADITIRATGNQWYWTHEYVDNKFEFDSVILERDELEANGYLPDEYLLATDTPVVIPSGKNIVVQVTSSDVIHAWTIPAFGVKQDAVPGRVAELWFNVDEGKEGLYFGQCSELCGKNHAYMPITVKVVTQAEYEKWLDGAIEEYAGVPRSVTVAEANLQDVSAAKASN